MAYTLIYRLHFFSGRILACTNFFGTSAVTGFEYTYDLFGRPVQRNADAFACDSHQGAGGVGGLVAVSVAGM